MAETSEAQVQYHTEFLAWLSDNYTEIEEDQYMNLRTDETTDRDGVARHYLTTI